MEGSVNYCWYESRMKMFVVLIWVMLLTCLITPGTQLPTNVKPEVIVHPDNATVKNGNTVVLKCSFNMAVDCGWQRNGSTMGLKEEEYHFINQNNGRNTENCDIQIKFNYRRDATAWQCFKYTSYNDNMTAHSNVAYLTKYQLSKEKNFLATTDPMNFSYVALNKDTTNINLGSKNYESDYLVPGLIAIICCLTVGIIVIAVCYYLKRNQHQEREGDDTSGTSNRWHLFWKSFKPRTPTLVEEEDREAKGQLNSKGTNE